MEGRMEQHCWADAGLLSDGCWGVGRKSQGTGKRETRSRGFSHRKLKRVGSVTENLNLREGRPSRGEVPTGSCREARVGDRSGVIIINKVVTCWMCARHRAVSSTCTIYIRGWQMMAFGTNPPHPWAYF